MKSETIKENVNHPKHYGGNDNPLEAIKVIEGWGLDFCLGNTVKYIARAGKKGGPDKELEDLQKALWYLQRRIEQVSWSQTIRLTSKIDDDDDEMIDKLLNRSTGDRMLEF